jgi:hypothetical protein
VPQGHCLAFSYFILDFNLVPYIFKVSIWSLIFILSFNLVLYVSFVTCGRRFVYVDRHMDTLTLGHMSKLNGVNDKIDGNDQLMQTMET